MEKPTTLCDRCEKQFSCLLNYDGVPCRKNRTVEPTNYDRIISKTPEELAEWLWLKVGKCPPFDVCPSQCIPCEAKDCWLDWLKQEEPS